MRVVDNQLSLDIEVRRFASIKFKGLDLSMELKGSPGYVGWISIRFDISGEFEMRLGSNNFNAPEFVGWLKPGGRFLIKKSRFAGYDKHKSWVIFSAVLRKASEIYEKPQVKKLLRNISDTGDVEPFEQVSFHDVNFDDFLGIIKDFVYFSSDYDAGVFLSNHQDKKHIIHIYDLAFSSTDSVFLVLSDEERDAFYERLKKINKQTFYRPL